MNAYSERSMYFNPGATEEEIEELEKEFDITLPEDHREFLLFANGARIMSNFITLYGIDLIGIEDPMVPEEYYTIGELVGDGTRLAFCTEDGKIYSCYDGDISKDDLKETLTDMLKECNYAVKEREYKKQQALKDPETLKKEEEYDAYMDKIKKSLGLL